MTELAFDKKHIQAYMADKGKLVQDYIEEVWNQKIVEVCSKKNQWGQIPS